MWLLGLLVACVLNAATEAPSPMGLLDDKLPLAAGETFAFSILEDNEEPIALYVNADGSVDFPLLGTREVVGKTPKALAEELKADLEKDYYYTATVLVDRALPAKGRVFISGQVGTTGSMEIPPTQVWTLSKAVLSAGGFTDNADRTRVAIVRKDPAHPGVDSRQEYDVGKMLETGDFSLDPIIRPGDLILIPKLDLSARVTVSGQVNSPGLYNVPRSDFTVSQAVLSAGGFTQYANEKRVKLIRTDKGGKRTVTYVNLKKVLEDGRQDLDPVVLPGDTINIPERFVNF